MKKVFKFLIVFAVLYLPYYFYTRTNFEFDEAIHYSITDEKSEKIDTINSIYEVIYEDYPYEMKDLRFVNNLERNGFIKKPIPTHNHSELRTILRSQFGMGFLFSKKCLPVYRDIIIFKKNDKVSGIAKICFGCGQHQFIGNSLDDSNFYNYDGLKQLLYSK
jgi:hypothetical protein